MGSALLAPSGLAARGARGDEGARARKCRDFCVPSRGGAGLAPPTPNFIIMRPIFLIGFMGCGKTTLGKALAKALGRQFVDLDLYIEGRYHATVRQIFAARGEAGFRELERKVLNEVADFEDVVIACGGGTPCHFGNMAHMLGRGLTVYLTVPPRQIAGRLSLPGSRARRPLVDGMSPDQLLDYVTAAIAEREPFYSRAEITFCASRIEDAEQTAETAARLASVVLSRESRGESPRERHGDAP